MAKTLLPVVWLRIVPKIAIPKAPAIFLARARTDEAEPISLCGTAEAIMLVRWAIPKPMPKAMMKIGIMMSIDVERGSIHDSK